MICAPSPGLGRLPRLWTRRSRKRKTCRLWIGECRGVRWWAGTPARCRTPEARRYLTPQGTLYMFGCMEDICCLVR